MQSTRCSDRYGTKQVETGTARNKCRGLDPQASATKLGQTASLSSAKKLLAMSKMLRQSQPPSQPRGRQLGSMFGLMRFGSRWTSGPGVCDVTSDVRRGRQC